MERTPEEIKKGLECCFSGRIGRCEGCPYRGLSFCNTIMGTNAVSLVRQLEAQVPKWISVEQRLPEDTGGFAQTVNVYTENGDVLVGFCHNGRWYVLYDCNDYCTEATDSEVTHWMPLPEGPKEG